MVPRDVCGVARGVVVAVDSRRLLGLRDERQDVAAAEHRTSSHRHSARRSAPASGRRCRPIAVIPADDCDVCVEQLADLVPRQLPDVQEPAFEDVLGHDARAVGDGEHREQRLPDSAFEIAVARSSVKSSSRCSVPPAAALHPSPRRRCGPRPCRRPRSATRRQHAATSRARPPRRAPRLE